MDANTSRRPLVSVLLTSFNYEQYVGHAIQSVLDQTYAAWELIVYDDASSDRSLEVIRSFRDPRLKILAGSRNRGGATAYNQAFTASQGELICSLDCDDAYAPDKLVRQVAFLEAHPAIDVLGTHVREIDCRGQLVGGTGEYELSFNRYERPEEPESWLLRNHLCHSSVMIRRTAHERAGLMDPGLFYLLDYEHWLRFLRLGCRFGVLAEPLTFYRGHAQNASRRDQGDRHFLECSFLCLYRLYPWLADLGRHDLIRQAMDLFIVHHYRRAGVDARKRVLHSLVTGQQIDSFSQFLSHNPAPPDTPEAGICLLDVFLADDTREREQRAWIAHLEAAYARFEQDRTLWRQLAEDRQAVIDRQQAIITRLDQEVLALKEGHHARALVDAYWRSLSGRLSAPWRWLRARVRGRPPEQLPVVHTPAEAQAMVCQIAQSRGWRLTRPLRWGKRLISRYRRAG